jgi:hypothetical protein
MIRVTRSAQAPVMVLLLFLFADLGFCLFYPLWEIRQQVMYCVPNAVSLWSMVVQETAL